MKKDEPISEFEMDFYRAYERVLHSLGKDACKMSRKSIIERTILSPAETYYTNAEAVLRQLSYYSKYGRFNVKRRCVAEKYYDIMRKYKQLLPSRSGMKAIDIANEVALSQAPRFYINTKSAFYIYYRVLKKKCNGKVA